MKTAKQIDARLREIREGLEYRVNGTDADRLLNRGLWEREKYALTILNEILEWAEGKDHEC